jgi:hypothetical protein
MKLCNVCRIINENFDQKEYRGMNTIMRKKMATFETRTQLFNTVCYLFTVPLPVEDSTFTSIFIAVDKLTHFIHIRPLCSTEVSDVAVELYKMFMDFGLPETIETSEDKYYKLVIKAVNLIEPEAITYVATPSDPVNDCRAAVILNLQKWMKESNCDDWTVACSMVQYAMNNTHNTDINCTPYKAVFGRKPNFIDKPDWSKLKQLIHPIEPPKIDDTNKETLVQDNATVTDLVDTPTTNKDFIGVELKIEYNSSDEETTTT